MVDKFMLILKEEVLDIFSCSIISRLKFYSYKVRCIWVFLFFYVKM